MKWRVFPLSKNVQFLSSLLGHQSVSCALIGLKQSNLTGLEIKDTNNLQAIIPLLYEEYALCVCVLATMNEQLNQCMRLQNACKFCWW